MQAEPRVTQITVFLAAAAEEVMSARDEHVEEIIRIIRDGKLPFNVMDEVTDVCEDHMMQSRDVKHVYVSLLRPLTLGWTPDGSVSFNVRNATVGVVMHKDPLPWATIVQRELTPVRRTMALLVLELADHLGMAPEMQPPGGGGLKAALITPDTFPVTRHRVTWFEDGHGPVGHIIGTREELVREMLANGYTEWSPGTCDNIMADLAESAASRDD